MPRQYRYRAFNFTFVIVDIKYKFYILLNNMWCTYNMIVISKFFII
jgi:hypothetical protein